MDLDKFEKLDQKEQEKVQDRFKNLYDMFCYEDDGQLTKEFKIFVVGEVN